MKTLRILRMIRVHIVLGGVLAFSLGGLLAIVNGGSFDPARFVLYYAIVFFGDLSTHFSNDYFDVEVDKHGELKKHFSGSHILVYHPGLRPMSWLISISLLASSITLAAVAVLFLGAPLILLIIAAGANFLGLAYSAPPLRLTSRGLGEVAIALATGFAIPATGYLAGKGQLDSVFVYFAVPFVMYGLMLALSLEAPDKEIDLRGGKRNIAVRKGELAVFAIILAAVLLASLVFLFINLLTPITVIDLRVVFAFSFVPLVVGVAGFFVVFQKKEVNRFSVLNVASLFVFNLLMVTYLFAIALSK